MNRLPSIFSFETLALMALMAFLASTNVIASSHPLLSITNDENKDVVQILVNENEDEITSFRQVLLDSRGKNIGDVTYDVEKDLTGKQVTLLREKQYEVVNLAIDKNFAPHNGGFILIDYLKDGRKKDITKQRGLLELELSRTGEGWEVLRGGSPVSELHFKSKKVFILGTVGIDSIISK